MKLWIARDPNDALWLFEKRPTYYEGVKGWGCMYGEKFNEINYNYFPEVTFENSPQEVELKLVQ